MGVVLMKKNICFILVISMLLLCGCTSSTENWKEIDIADCGTLKIPDEWTFLIENGIMYIIDGDKPIMISCKRTGENESNLYFSDYKYVEFISSSVLSNGPIYGKAKYLYEDSPIELYYLDLGYTLHDDELIEFVVWDQEISEDFLINIAKTFVSY